MIGLDLTLTLLKFFEFECWFFENDEYKFEVSKIFEFSQPKFEHLPNGTTIMSFFIFCLLDIFSHIFRKIESLCLYFCSMSVGQSAIAKFVMNYNFEI